MTSDAYRSIHAWLMDWMVKEFGLQAGELSADASFLNVGMNSIQAMMLVGDLEAHLNVRLKPTLVWDYPTIAGLASHLVEQKSAEPTERDRTSRNGETTLPAAAARSAENPEELLAKLNDLSEGEIDALLAKYQPQSP